MEEGDALAAPGTFGPPPQYPIESVDKALQVLALLGERPSLRMTDVSTRLKVATSTAHRLLAMLQYRGFVRQDPDTRRYLAGPALDALAFGAMRRFDVRRLAHPVLVRLSAELGETVHFGQLEGTDVRFIDSIESERALRVASRLGRSMPAHCTSTGKALLAALPEGAVPALYPEEALPQLTPRSIGTRTELLRVLALVRERGYAVSHEESEEGVSSVTMALRSGHPAGLAVNVSVPVSRMSAAAQEAIVARLAQARHELEQVLAGLG